MFATGLIHGLAGLLALIIIVPAVILLWVFWIWMLVDAIQNKGLSDGEKVGWVLAIVFFHLLGSLLYLCLGRPKRRTPLVAA
jgi:NADH:ubiquinone oxidoreductase subunit 6 (subunit J)